MAIGIGGLAAVVSSYGMALRLPRLTGRGDGLVVFMARVKKMPQLTKYSSHEAI